MASGGNVDERTRIAGDPPARSDVRSAMGSKGSAEVRGGERRASTLLMWVRAIRVHQWSKNALILMPVVAAHRALSRALVADLLTAVASFSLLASAVYLVNDLADLEHDRLHPLKRRRPLASGRLTPPGAAAASVGLLAVSAALALRLPTPFLASWAAYLVLSTAYSLALKRVVMLDVLVLAGLYAVRVVAGATAVDVSLSRWFLAFAVFLFASLAMLKRSVEIRGAVERNAEHLAGRGWRVADRGLLLAFGGAASVAAALVYCLYITGDEALHLYRSPDFLWLGLPVLLYWQGRVWLLANRGEVHEDPLLFALRDPVSYGVLVLMGALVWAAT